LSEALQYRNKLILTDHGPEIQNVILGIIGRKGTGKSTLTKEILQHGEREFIFDTAGDHTWVPDRFTEIDQAYQYIFDQASSPAPFIGSFVPEGDDDETLQRDFSEISTAIWESGNVTYVVEELPMLSNPQWAPPRFNRILRLGRHRAINIAYTGQRASEVPRRATGATDVFVLFHTSEPTDLDRIAERCGPETAAIVRKLAEHEFVVYDVRSRSLILVDNRWYDCVLNSPEAWTPAVGGKHGRPALWSLDDGE
jgi:hypothetical protein